MGLALPLAIAVWLGGWWVNVRLAARKGGRGWRLLPPLVFGVTVLARVGARGARPRR